MTTSSCTLSRNDFHPQRAHASLFLSHTARIGDPKTASVPSHFHSWFPQQSTVAVYTQVQRSAAAAETAAAAPRPARPQLQAPPPPGSRRHRASREQSYSCRSKPTPASSSSSGVAKSTVRRMYESLSHLKCTCFAWTNTANMCKSPLRPRLYGRRLSCRDRTQPARRRRSLRQLPRLGRRGQPFGLDRG